MSLAQHSTRRSARRFALAAACAAFGFALILAGGSEVWSDDTQLFKVEAGKPFVFIMLDTSSSMNLALDGTAVPGSGDDPRSRFRQAKEALFEVFAQVQQENPDLVHFGFATFNQDHVRVRGKHWLYRVAGISGGLPIPYLAAGDDLTFGKHFDFGPGTFPGVAGTPCAPLPLRDALDRQRLDRFSKLEPTELNSNGQDLRGPGEIDGYRPTYLWIEVPVGGGLDPDAVPGTYLLIVENQPRFFGPDDSLLSGKAFGHARMRVNFTLRRLTDPTAVGCDPNPALLTDGLLTSAFTAPETTTVLLRNDLIPDYPSQFLLYDETGPDSIVLADSPLGNASEAVDGLWNWQDVQAGATCGDDAHPFSGEGWESNYDGTFVSGTNPFPPSQAETTDPYCLANDDSCNLKLATTLQPSPATNPNKFRPLDQGDLIPLHWDDTHRLEFFGRLSPNFGSASVPEFRAAPYFFDVPDATGVLQLRDHHQRPLLPVGASPLNKSVVDFRCFYLGGDTGGNKCRSSLQPFGNGWDALARVEDFDEWGCRRPFLILIGDAEENCGGENPAADTANISGARIRVWGVDFDAVNNDCANANSTYFKLARNTGGECLNPTSKAQLVAELRRIVGLILEETRSFASAAVPTVQADVADKVFLSNFIPLNDAAVWPGRVDAFLKPVPLNEIDNTPETTDPAFFCENKTERSQCFLWNAGAEMLSQVQADPANQFGTAADQRRIYYSRLSETGLWPEGRRYFKLISNATDTRSVRFDLWRGLGISFNEAEVPVVDPTLHVNFAAETTANEVVADTLRLKFFDPDGQEIPPDPTDDLPYILGDIFHSNPVVVGNPTNTIFFANDTQGYRAFAQKHQRRRKVLLVGANDGMVHAIDAGVFRASAADPPGAFDDGTGKELFGFVPRTILPVLNDLFAGVDGLRAWSVDGNIGVADVFIDPLAGDSEGREWRTVAVGGLRRGGRGYYALDVTQPDTYDTDGNPEVADGAYVPLCSGSASDGSDSSFPAACGPLPYPAQLWEFTDGVLFEDASSGNPIKAIPLDEDGIGGADLSNSWSTPNLGRIRVVQTDGTGADEEVDKFVAVFGGGLNKSGSSGNWLYMVDIETGKSIYKRRLQEPGGGITATGGSAPAEPAAVDTNGDGYLDRIYLGTTKGYMYRADLRGPNGELPRLESAPLLASDGTDSALDLASVRILDDAFAPRIIFKAIPSPSSGDEEEPPEDHPIYFRPSVVFIASSNQYALAFGTGDRESLWTDPSKIGRFYVFRDDIAVGDRTTFYTEANLQQLTLLDGTQNQDFLTTGIGGVKGWFLVLNPGDRLITNPFALAGILIFTSFDPDVQCSVDGTVVPCDSVADANNVEPTCSRTGDSRIFAVNITNGNGLFFAGDGTPTRFITIQDFVTDPFTEQGQTKNPPGDQTKPTADDIPEQLEPVLENLKTLFPPNCKFGNFRIDVKTLSSDTGIIFIAPVPVCIIEGNWKEF